MNLNAKEALVPEEGTSNEPRGCHHDQEPTRDKPKRIIPCSGERPRKRNKYKHTTGGGRVGKNGGEPKRVAREGEAGKKQDDGSGL